MKTLNEQHIAILIGKPGDGKTTTTYQVMYEISHKPAAQKVDCLENIKQKRAVLIQSPDEWQKLDPTEELIVYFDDCFGSTNFNREAAAKWKSSLDSIYASAKRGNVFVLIGLQSTILERVKKYFCHHRLFSEEFNVNISHLDENEKKIYCRPMKKTTLKASTKKCRVPWKPISKKN